VGVLFSLLFVLALLFTAYSVVKIESKEDGHSVSFHPLKGFPGLIAAILSLALCLSYTQVNSGSMGVVYNQGKAVRAIAPGPHLVMPFLETVSPVSNKTLVWQPNEDGASNDLQRVTTQVTLAYHFDPNYAIYFATQLISAEPNSVENKVVNPAIVEAVKAVTAQFNATDLIQKRAQVRDAIEAMVKTRLAQYHIVAETVSITDFQFTKEYNDSIEAKVKAQQDAERAENELVKTKVEAQKTEAEAKGVAAANVAAAEGEAKAIMFKADAQAKANRELAASITPELILNKAVEKWDGVRPMVEGGKSGLLLQLPAMNHKTTTAAAEKDDNSDNN
jgi:regulator of protease activity HflC (stomatin/prohibitin superfamily)